MSDGWIGVDLDGTLAAYNGWKGVDHIGAPITTMVRRVQKWLADGKRVKIFTARVHNTPEAADAIRVWCRQHIGQVIEVTNVKDYAMIELWDDRAVQVIPNTGERADGKS
jgi:hypothetical protein